MIQYAALFKKLSSLSPGLFEKLDSFTRQRMVSADITEEEAIRNDFNRWIQSIEEKNFFAYIHFNTPHAAYDPPSPYDVFAKDPSVSVSRDAPEKYAALPEDLRLRLLSLYYGEIYCVDFMVGQILEDLKKSGQGDKTIVAVTADHGEEFYDHNSWGHAHTMYNELLHIPMIFYVPGFRDAPARIENYASIIDIGPTLLSLTGFPNDSFMDGKDLTPLLQGSRQDVHDFIIAQDIRSQAPQSTFTIIRDGYKFIEQTLQPEKNQRLFDLRKDFEEKDGLPLKNSPVLEELKKQLLEMNRYTFRKRIVSKKVRLSNEKKDELKALGYIQ